MCKHVLQISINKMDQTNLKNKPRPSKYSFSYAENICINHETDTPCHS